MIVIGNIFFFLFSLLLSKAVFEKMSLGIFGGLYGKYFYPNKHNAVSDLFWDDLNQIDNVLPFSLWGLSYFTVKALIKL